MLVVALGVLLKDVLLLREQFLLWDLESGVGDHRLDTAWLLVCEL